MMNAYRLASRIGVLLVLLLVSGCGDNKQTAADAATDGTDTPNSDMSQDTDSDAADIDDTVDEPLERFITQR